MAGSVRGKVAGVLVGAALAVLAGGAQGEAPRLTLQGSTTFNSVLMAEHQAAIEAAAGVRLTVVANKSNIGLLALLDGAADMAMLSTPLANELELIGRSRPGVALDRLQAVEVGRTEAALIVHPDNPVRHISQAALRQVLAGEIVNWRGLGGADLPIRIVAVRDGGGVVTTVEMAVLGAGAHIAAPQHIRIQNGPQIVRIVEQEPGGLGITQLKLARGRGVARLMPETPIVQQLFLVSLGAPTAGMLAVIAACQAWAGGGPS